MPSGSWVARSVLAAENEGSWKYRYTLIHSMAVWDDDAAPEASTGPTVLLQAAVSAEAEGPGVASRRRKDAIDVKGSGPRKPGEQALRALDKAARIAHQSRELRDVFRVRQTGDRSCLCW